MFIPDQKFTNLSTLEDILQEYSSAACTDEMMLIVKPISEKATSFEEADAKIARALKDTFEAFETHYDGKTYRLFGIHGAEKVLLQWSDH